MFVGVASLPRSQATLSAPQPLNPMCFLRSRHVAPLDVTLRNGIKNSPQPFACFALVIFPEGN